MDVPQRTKHRVVIQFRDPTLGQISEKKKTLIWKDARSNVNSSTVYNSQDMEATQMSVNREVGKEDVVYLYNGIYSTMKRMKWCQLQPHG